MPNMRLGVKKAHNQLSGFYELSTWIQIFCAFKSLALLVQVLSSCGWLTGISEDIPWKVWILLE